MKEEEKNTSSIEDSLNKVIEMPKKKTRYLAVVDDETGEIETYIKLNPKNLGKGWIALFQNPSLWLAQQNFDEKSKVLFYLFGKLDFENYLRVSRKEIAEWLGINPTRVSRAMKALKDLGIIVEGPAAGKFKTYRLNPLIAHKGKNLRNTVLDFDKYQDRKLKNDIKKIETERNIADKSFGNPFEESDEE